MKKSKPFLIGVAGGISSGKSSVCKKIIDELSELNQANDKHILVISLDSFYKQLTGDELSRAERGDHNLDHPDSFDEELAYTTLTNLIEGKREVVKIPVYDKKSYQESGEQISVRRDTTPDVIIIEGVLVFYYPKIRNLCQMKLFVDCDADTRLSRRVIRDMTDYKRPLDQILSYYQKFVKPAFEEFCLPTKKYADVIIPRGVENLVAINLIVQHLNDYLNLNIHQNANNNINNLNNNNNNNKREGGVQGKLRIPRSVTTSSKVGSRVMEVNGGGRSGSGSGLSNDDDEDEENGEDEEGPNSSLSNEEKREKEEEDEKQIKKKKNLKNKKEKEEKEKAKAEAATESLKKNFTHQLSVQVGGVGSGVSSGGHVSPASITPTKQSGRPH